MTESAEWIAMARLVRRTGFGATGTAVDAAMKMGAPAYLRSILDTDPLTDKGAISTPLPTLPAIARIEKNAAKDARRLHQKQLKAQLDHITEWWLSRMMTVEQPFAEMLTFCWHNHFATAATKVHQAAWMVNQNQKLRTMGRGDFRPLSLAMLTDAAMLFWLDGQKNTAAAPNENLSREFMELFALGHTDQHGAATYTEADVREGARALTGWKIRTDGSTFVNRAQQDQGSKTFLGVSGNLDLTGYCDAILSRPAAPGFLVTRWWRQLVSPTGPSASALSAITAAYGGNRSLSSMFAAMLGHPEFAAAQGTLIIDPVQWLIGLVRSLNVPVTPTSLTSLAGVLRSLGQVPFYPPNVSGWPSGQAWLSSAAADVRMRAALSVAKAGDVSSVSKAAPTDRLDALGYLLGVGLWSPRTAAVLRPQLSNPTQLVAIAVNSPEYLVH